MRFLSPLVLAFVVARPVQAESVLIVADEWPAMEILEKHLAANGFAVEKCEQMEMPEDLSGYHAIFNYVHSRFRDEPAQAMVDYANSGGRLILLHHGINSGQVRTKGWLDFVGLVLDKKRTAKMRYHYYHDISQHIVNINPNHYITSNKAQYPEVKKYSSTERESIKGEYPAFVLHGSEVYINQEDIAPEGRVLLLGFHFEDEKMNETVMQDRAGWLKKTGKGWLIYFQPGHTPAEFEDPTYQQILLNALTWTPE